MSPPAQPKRSQRFFRGFESLRRHGFGRRKPLNDRANVLGDDVCAGAQEQHFSQQNVPFGCVLAPRKGPSRLGEPLEEQVSSKIPGVTVNVEPADLGWSDGSGLGHESAVPHNGCGLADSSAGRLLVLIGTVVTGNADAYHSPGPEAQAQSKIRLHSYVSIRAMVAAATRS